MRCCRNSATILMLAEKWNIIALNCRLMVFPMDQSCRGLGVHDAPGNLMRTAGINYIEAVESEVCCGFGGTYSAKFPELSTQFLDNKLNNVEDTGADLLLTDCPGCIMQLRGGLKKRESEVEVKHTIEALAERRKKKQ